MSTIPKPAEKAAEKTAEATTEAAKAQAEADAKAAAEKAAEDSGATILVRFTKSHPDYGYFAGDTAELPVAEATRLFLSNCVEEAAD